MKEKIGVIKEVFIPNDNIDVVNPKTIGFKVELNGSIIDIIQPINDEVSTILKNDKVVLIEKIIDDKKYFDIEKIEDGEDYERI